MYRDEREVLRDEVYALRREVEQARADQERLAGVEKELEAAQRKLAKLEASQLGQPSPQGGSVPILAIVAAALLVAGGAAAFILLRASPRPAPAPAIQTAKAVATAQPTAVPTVEPPVTASPATPPAPVGPTAHTRWRATVTKVVGVPIAVGAACTIEADVLPDDSGMHVEEVVVKCGTHALYDPSGELEGMSESSSDAEQHAGPKQGTWTYAFAYSDVGQRGPTRNQVMLDSTKKLGKVWSDNLPDFRVDLALQPDSEPTNVAVREQK